MSQLALPFQTSANLYKKEDFLLTEENAKAFKALKTFFNQKDFSVSQITQIILKGEKSSGKTHLLNNFAVKTNAEFLNKSDLLDVNLVSIFSKNQFYILEDFNEISDENLLFHILNAANEANAFLVLSCNYSPNFKLKDLNSRLKNIPIAEIENLSEETAKQLLTNYLARKQIRLSAKFISAIVQKIDRNYQSLLDASKRVELAIQENGKGFSLKIIEKIF